MPPAFIYFDLGNVLMRFSNERMCRQMAAVAGVEPQRVIDLLIATGTPADPQWQFEAGQFSEDEYYQFFCEGVGGRPARVALEIAAADMFKPIEETHALAEALRASNHRLGLLSNTNAWHWKFLLNGQWPTLNNAFEIEVTSFGARSMKPDRRIYELAIKRAGVPAEQIFFTDDRDENVQGAIDLGIDAVQFQSTEQLERELRSRGVEW